MKVQQRVSRFLTDSVPLWEPTCHSRSSFYREEFIKCQRCLDQQREYYSESAVTDVEQALTKVMSQLDSLCNNEDADQVVSRLLRQLAADTSADELMVTTMVYGREERRRSYELLSAAWRA